LTLKLGYLYAVSCWEVIRLAKKEETVTSGKNNKTVVIIVVVVGVLIVLGIVGRMASQYMARKAAGGFLSALTGGKANVDVTKNEVTVKDKDGNEITIGGEGTKLPNDFPKAFPTPKGGKVITSWTSNTDTSMGVSVVWEVGDSINDAYTSYKTAVESAGYKITATFSADETMTFSFEKEKEQGSIGVGKGDGDKTNITLMYSADK
jgi:hypothetical protein